MSAFSSHDEAPKRSTILGLNIHSLRFHQPGLALLLNTMTSKPDIIILTETWLTENDPIDKLNIKGYQPFESKPRTYSKRSSGGVGAYFSEACEYQSINFETVTECAIYQVTCSDKKMVFCVLYRPETVRLARFFEELEKLLYFLSSMNQKILFFGDFNIDTLKDEKVQRDYKNLLSAYNLGMRNFEPTRVTPTSKTCIDHFITTNENETETLQTTISDHFTVSAQVSHNLANKQHDPPCTKVRNLKNFKGEKALNFLFLLDQNLKKLPQHLNANDYMDALAKSIMETVDKFAPEKRAENNKKHFKETWITNEIKIAIVKRINLFEKWIHNPAKTNRERYKNERNNVTNLIRKEKRNENFQKLGENPTPKQIYKTLKTKKNQAQNTNLPDVEILNNYFLSVG